MQYVSVLEVDVGRPGLQRVEAVLRAPVDKAAVAAVAVFRRRPEIGTAGKRDRVTRELKRT